MTTKPLIIDVEPEAEPTEPAPKNNCATCKGGKFDKTAPMGECRMLPPQMTIFMMQYFDPITRAPGVRPDARSGWPAVRRDNYCLSWQPRDTH